MLHKQVQHFTAGEQKMSKELKVATENQTRLQVCVMFVFAFMQVHTVLETTTTIMYTQFIFGSKLLTLMYVYMRDDVMHYHVIC